MTDFFLIVRRECLLSWRRPVEWLNPLLFFILVAVLFPLTLAPGSRILPLIGPGVLWVAVLLAVLLSLPRLFQADYEDGSLEQALFSSQPFAVMVFAKIMAHAIMLCIPLLCVTPLLALMYHLPFHITMIWMLTVITGAPILILLGGIGAALTISIHQSGLLLALILLPLYIPTLIFATSALSAVAGGISPTASLLWLSALLSFTLVIAPSLIAVILKMGIAHR
jgi:heme exporter protein B